MSVTCLNSGYLRMKFRVKIPLFGCRKPPEELSLSEISVFCLQTDCLKLETQFLKRKLLGEEGTLPPQLELETLLAAVSVEGQGSSTAFHGDTRQPCPVPCSWQRSKAYLLSF